MMKNLEDFRKTSIVDNKKYTYLQFERFSDLVNIVEENIGKCTNSKLILESELKTNTEWFGTSSIEEAIKLARSGWKEGVTNLNKSIKIANQDLQFKNKYDVVGAHVSIPRFINNIPNNMVRKIPLDNKNKVITLVKVQSVISSATAANMMDNAIKFIQIIQNLEAQGYRCNVYIIFASSGKYDENSVVRLKVKNSNERLNLTKICFPTVHPSTFRRFIFKIREIDKYFEKSIESFNYGVSFFGGTKQSHSEFRQAMKDIKPYIKKDEYFIPYLIDDPSKFELKQFQYLY